MKVLVLTARGLRADYLGCYGNSWVATPALDSLASAGIVFDRHLADRADPAGAGRAWRTGCYELPAAPPLPTPPSDLLDALAAAEIPTVLVRDESRDQSDEFDRSWGRVERADSLEAALALASETMKVLAEDDRSLIWVEFATLLPPWDVPEDFAAPYFEEEELDDDEEEIEPLTPLPDPEVGSVDPEDDTLFLRLQATHAGAVSLLDAGIGHLLDEIGDDVLILVTSDVGQFLGEHGVLGPWRAWLHAERVHVPLLIRLPAGVERGQRVEALTQHVDLMPTLAEALGVPVSRTHGQSLWPLIRGEVREVRPYAVSAARVGGAVEWALRSSHWAFLLPVEADPELPPCPIRLYVKPDDRWEVNDVAQHHPERAEAMERTLREFAASLASAEPLRYPPLPSEAAGTTAPRTEEH